MRSNALFHVSVIAIGCAIGPLSAGAQVTDPFPQVVWVDIDGDGLEDLIRFVPGSPPQCFLNDGEGGFIVHEISSPVFAEPVHDVRVVNSGMSGPATLVMMGESGTVAVEVSGSVARVQAHLPAARAVDLRDFDGDDRVDVVLDGRIYRQVQGGKFAEVLLPESPGPSQHNESLPTPAVQGIAGDLVVGGVIEQASGRGRNLFMADVGIGVGQPAHRLDVDGDVSARFYYGDGSQLEGVSGDGLWDAAEEGISFTDGNVGIGTDPVSSSRLKVQAEGASGTDGVHAYSQTGSGVHGDSYDVSGVYGTGPTGVHGSGDDYGVRGEIHSGSGAALYGHVASGGMALHAQNDGFSTGAFIQNTNANNNAVALYTKTQGEGPAAVIEVDNALNMQPALKLHHDGIGSPLYVENYGTNSAISVLQNNGASIGSTIRIDSYSQGPAIWVGSWNGGPGLEVWSGESIFRDDVSIVGELDVSELIRAPTLEITGGADLAERFVVSGEAEPGMVVAIDRQHAGQLRVTSDPRDPAAVGVISGANGLHAGVVLSDGELRAGEKPIAMSGRVWVWCDATERPVGVGDRLTSGSRYGHAAAAPADMGPGVIGRAMTGLPLGEVGLVLMFVNPS